MIKQPPVLFDITNKIELTFQKINSLFYLLYYMIFTISIGLLIYRQLDKAILTKHIFV